MQKFKDCFIPSETELKRAAAHLRRLQRSARNREGFSTSYFRCYFLPESGRFFFPEFTDCLSCCVYNGIMLEIPYDCGASVESREHTAVEVREEIITAVKMARS